MYTPYTDTTYGALLLFAYKKDDIFDDVCHLSAFMAKNAATKEGLPLLEQYAISRDEEPMFGLCLRDCLPDLWEVMVKLTHGIDNPFDDAESGFFVREDALTGAIPADKYHAGQATASTTYKNLRFLADGSVVYLADAYASGTAEPGARYFCDDTDEYVTVRLLNNGACNPNIIKIVDSSIRSCVEQGVLVKWYTRIAQSDLLKIADAGFAAEATALGRRLMQLYRKSVLPS